MKVLINQNHRIFIITDSEGRTFAGNLEHIPEIIKEKELNDGYFSVYQYWNGKPKKISMKAVNKLLTFNGINK